MSELTVSAAGFILQPLINQRDGPCELRWSYTRSFLDSDGVQVQWGNGTKGFWVTTPCSIASGLINVDQDTLLWTTDDALDPAPQSLFVTVGLYSARGTLLQQLTIIGKTQFVVPSSLAPTTNWPDFSIYNEAVVLVNPPQVFYTAPQVDALVDRAFNEHPASDTELGTVLLTVPADIPATPVVWGANDPLVRDATSLQGVAISDTPPSDGQALVFNQANNDWEPGTGGGGGTGNVISNEVSSVDGNVTLASGTGGKTIKFDASAHFDGSGLLTGATVNDPTDDLDISNKEFVLASVAAAVQQTPNITALVSGGGVFWVSAYTFQVAAATYLIQGDLFTSVGQSITLDAAHATLDRIDVIALDDTGTLIKITGTPASQPSQPNVDPGTQLMLTFVLVVHNTTQPSTVSNTNIYIDNAEWTATTSGSGWNVNSTNNPYSGTKCIEGTTVANAAYVQLQAPAPLTLDTFSLLSVFIASKAAWPKKRSLVFQWYTAGVAVGQPITVNTGFFGFDSSNTAYQLLAIPMAQFAVPASTSLNQLRITDQGGAIGMYIDNLVLQANGTGIGTPPATGITQAQADARYLRQANNLSEVASASTSRTNIGAAASGAVTASGLTMATNKLLGRGSASTGAIEEITLGSNLSFAGTTLNASGSGSSIPSSVQGDTLYASAANTFAVLAKDTNATRYLSNTGSSNNPAWAQVALATGISGFGTGVATALAVNVGSAGAPVVFNGALGTPSSGTLSSCSGLPISTGVSGLGTGVATFLATPSSANLASALTDETGSGLAVFATSPVFSTDITLPNSATPTTGSVAKVAFDTDAWAASRGAIQVHDGTANTFVVAALASDTPSNGQVPTWNTGGTITWETPSSGGTFNSTTGSLPYLSSANVFSDTPLFRESANSIAQRNSTNNQIFYIYKTFTDASNYSRWRIAHDGTNNYQLITEAAGTGSHYSIELKTNTRSIVLSSSALIPDSNSVLGLGSGSNRWSEVRGVNTYAQTAFNFEDGTQIKPSSKAGIPLINSDSAGNGTWTGGNTTAAQITSDKNDYDPGGQSYFQRWSSDASRNVTGIGRSITDGMMWVVVNVGSQNIVLQNQNIGSSATHRFLTSTGADITLSANQAADLIYDNTVQRWLVWKRN